jgi:hypothetical protein
MSPHTASNPHIAMTETQVPRVPEAKPNETQSDAMTAVRKATFLVLASQLAATRTGSEIVTQ